MIVSVDGGCDGDHEDVKAGVIAATSQQYPQKMAAMGVEAGVEAAAAARSRRATPTPASTLIAAEPVAGVERKDATFGAENCWG